MRVEEITFSWEFSHIDDRSNDQVLTNEQCICIPYSLITELGWGVKSVKMVKSDFKSDLGHDHLLYSNLDDWLSINKKVVKDYLF